MENFRYRLRSLRYDRPRGLEQSVTPLQEVSSALESLSDGEIDVLAVPASEIIGSEAELADTGARSSG